MECSIPREVMMENLCLYKGVGWMGLEENPFFWSCFGRKKLVVSNDHTWAMIKNYRLEIC
jgi:hypothetical protein